MNALRTLQIAVVLSATSCASFAQSVISAQSGLIHYYEGEVSLDKKMIETKFGEFPQMKANQVIETQLGRVEITLTPGVLLRLGENSAMRMVSPRLENTTLEFLRGSAIVEVVQPMRSDQLTFLYKGAEVPIEKDGLYRLDSEPSRLQVYEGQVEVRQTGQTYTVKSGHMLDFGSLLVEKFDAKKGDALYRWAKRRSEQLAVANVSSARSMRGVSSGQSSWIYNPYFGMMTFVPGGGSFYSPFGWAYFSPYTVGQFYSNYYYYPGRQLGVRPGLGGTNTATSGWNASTAQPASVSTRSASMSRGPAMSSPGMSASAPSAVSSSRGSDSGSGLSGGGGHSGGGGRGGH